MKDNDTYAELGRRLDVVLSYFDWCFSVSSLQGEERERVYARRVKAEKSLKRVIAILDKTSLILR